MRNREVMLEDKYCCTKRGMVDKYMSSNPNRSENEKQTVDTVVKICKMTLMLCPQELGHYVSSTVSTSRDLTILIPNSWILVRDKEIKSLRDWTYEEEAQD